MEKETTNYHKVFFEKKEVCNMGVARYQLDLARVEKYSVTKDFAAAVCSLPKKYDQGAYRRFIDNWGTVSVLTTFLVKLFLDNLLRPFLCHQIIFSPYVNKCFAEYKVQDFYFDNKLVLLTMVTILPTGV